MSGRKASAKGPGSGGHNSRYSEETAAEILRRIASGETLIELCQEKHIPAESTIRGWILDDHAGFARRYARAREMQIEHEVEQMKLISFRPEMGEETIIREVLNKSGEIETVKEVRRGDMFRHRELKIKTLQWRAEKIAKRYYGNAKEAEPEDQENKLIIEGGLPGG